MDIKNFIISYTVRSVLTVHGKFSKTSTISYNFLLSCCKKLLYQGGNSVSHFTLFVYKAREYVLYSF